MTIQEREAFVKRTCDRADSYRDWSKIFTKLALISAFILIVSLILKQMYVFVIFALVFPLFAILDLTFSFISLIILKNGVKELDDN